VKLASFFPFFYAFILYASKQGSLFKTTIAISNFFKEIQQRGGKKSEKACHILIFILILMTVGGDCY
jgi:uncharacterized membrane protein